MSVSIKETKEALDLAVSLVKAFKAAKADGKINILDIQHLIEPATKLAPAINGIGEVVDEWTNLTDTEIKEIVAFATQVTTDERFLTLVYHVIGMASSIIKLAKSDVVLNEVKS